MEDWRVKTYYRPRVLVSTGDLTSPPFDGTLVWLSGAELGLVRNLLAYAHRRSTFVSEYRAESYLAPTTEEWDTIQAIVSELESKLMATCCDDIVTALQAIVTEMGAQGDTLEAMAASLASIQGDVPDIVTALECLCAKQETIELNLTISPEWVSYPDATDYFGWGSETPVTTIGAQVDNDACELAQAWYQAGYEFCTEWFLPTLRFGFDKLLPAGAAALAAVTGGVAVPVVIGVYAMAELVQSLLQVAYDAAETNLVNWLFAHKQDIVCPLYFGLKDGGTSAGLWSDIQADLVAPASELSAGDKLIVNFLFGVVAPAAANVAKAQDSSWYQSVPEEGYCAGCAEPPIIGTDWWALPIGAVDGLLQISHPAGSYWQSGCWDYALPAGQTCVGMVYEVTQETGTCSLSRNSAATCGCSYAGLWPDSSGDSVPGLYFAYVDGVFDDAEAKAELAPGATEWTSWTQQTGGNVSAGFRLGYNCEGTTEVQVKYLVFSGTTP